jgi:hypothetical protein
MFLPLRHSLGYRPDGRRTLMGIGLLTVLGLGLMGAGFAQSSDDNGWDSVTGELPYIPPLPEDRKDTTSPWAPGNINSGISPAKAFQNNRVPGYPNLGVDKPSGVRKLWPFGKGSPDKVTARREGSPASSPSAQGVNSNGGGPAYPVVRNGFPSYDSVEGGYSPQYTQNADSSGFSVVSPIQPDGDFYAGSPEAQEKVQEQARGAQPRLPDPPPPAPKKSRIPFLRKKEAPPPPSEVVVNVGPRDTQPSQDPLVRLPLPILGNRGLVEPGFFLVKQKIISSQERQLFLTYRNQPMVTISVYATGESASLSSALNNGPVQSIPRPKPSVDFYGKPTYPTVMTYVRAQVSADQRSLKILVSQGNQRFESQPIPTVVEQRPELKY